ncbi:UDP-N-acetylmuramate dehydrogenase [Daejeonella oryzae]|uniref:UDP-N-acetylmuramate dehydrogenase n=1 Tax=Daejeonella oryzae TaxID=1122943 RepID=UPI0004237642|nr:UDP-N-acetylmuramate dehydrogenase [Daejeonella oryzae]
MISIHENYSLKSLNTFGVEARALWFTEICSEADLTELFSDAKWNSVERLILGGGSNILFTKDFEGLVIRISIPGIRKESVGNEILVTAGAGVVWNDLVNYCVDHHLAGMENLSLIPGSVGASPIQNIGAYGVELKDVFHSCKAFEISSGKIRIFSREECEFNYRDSIFKGNLKGKYIITEVTYKLSAEFHPQVSYGAITQELQKRGIFNPGIKDISEVVSHIRVSKLPDPATIGNAGSFFKNPLVTLNQFEQLQSIFPDIVFYKIGNDQVKLAAGWLIEQCGWKGRVVKNTGTWKNQALVLVNHGQATGIEVLNVSEDIINDVRKRFNIILEREVNIF